MAEWEIMTKSEFVCKFPWETRQFSPGEPAIEFWSGHYHRVTIYMANDQINNLVQIQFTGCDDCRLQYIDSLSKAWCFPDNDQTQREIVMLQLLLGLSDG